MPGDQDILRCHIQEAEGLEFVVQQGEPRSEFPNARPGRADPLSTASHQFGSRTCSDMLNYTQIKGLYLNSEGSTSADADVQEVDFARNGSPRISRPRILNCMYYYDMSGGQRIAAASLN